MYLYCIIFLFCHVMTSCPDVTVVCMHVAGPIPTVQWHHHIHTYILNFGHAALTVLEYLVDHEPACVHAQ